MHRRLSAICAAAMRTIGYYYEMFLCAFQSDFWESAVEQFWSMWIFSPFPLSSFGRITTNANYPPPPPLPHHHHNHNHHHHDHHDNGDDDQVTCVAWSLDDLKLVSCADNGRFIFFASFNPNFVKFYSSICVFILSFLFGLPPSFDQQHNFWYFSCFRLVLIPQSTHLFCRAPILHKMYKYLQGLGVKI